MVEIQVANPGSTLGEAIGALIEREVNRILRPIAEENNCVYVSAGRPNPRTGKATKLLLKDTAGNSYNIDSVIANQQMQPLVLIESKYIRYKKHNRDKGSWICTAHYSLRRTFPTVRKSIAVLAGSWSGSSKAMMQSFDVSLFEIGFQKIVETLAFYEIIFNWGEKERDKAIAAWQRWQQLSEDQYAEIACSLLTDIEPQLRLALGETLDTTIPRSIQEVEVTIETNLGESRRYMFGSIAEAVDFLESFDEEVILSDESGLALWLIEEDQQ
ncbi:hypothetical protein H6F67_21970 [Microcoleus sp. FACHB-1515]|uniref:hypothetical protein n=1 Tax=Cyanophyceae TaxID=3028117 RepID=UPI00168888C1|nr:hypothetical protein [Microcoleus sp. FACHB-1515]MBD2092520.1 hypothetical protein [Microcoleus sp. FACHB-1515]